MTLSADILAAADTIDQLNRHMEFGDKSTWNATELRNIARAVEEEEQEAVQLEILTARLAMDIFNTRGCDYPGSRTIAEQLIETGWRPSE